MWCGVNHATTKATKAGKRIDVVVTEHTRILVRKNVVSNRSSFACSAVRTTRYKHIKGGFNHGKESISDISV